MKTDAIYARYSSHAQDDGTSIDVQLERCEAAAGAKCQHYIDRAKTGRAMGGREALLKLLADCEAGRIGRVFVYKFDRLGRAAETHVIAQQLDDAGVELISATEGTNTLARGIQLVVAQDYSKQLAERTRDGLMKRFEQGAFTGGVAPYGYRVADRDGKRVLEIEPTEAEVVREVAHWYLCESVGFKLIAKRLRQRGIASRRGKGWCFTSVRSMLLNPVYTGRLSYNVRKMHLNRQTGRRAPRRKQHADVLGRQDESLRIISEADFQEIQSRVTRRAGYAPRARTGIAPLTGLVYCECGARCHRVTSRNAKGVYHYYLCSRKLRYDTCDHGGHRIREDAVMTLIQDRFAHLFRHRDRIIQRALEIARQAVESNRTDADRIKGEIAQLDAEQTRLVELLMDRAISDGAKQALNRKLADTEAKRNTLLAAIDGLREQATADTEGLAAAVEKAFDDARQSLAAIATPEAMNRFVERFVGPVTIQADGTIAQKELPATEVTSSLQSCIAGEGFEPSTSGL